MQEMTDDHFSPCFFSVSKSRRWTALAAECRGENDAAVGHGSMGSDPCPVSDHARLTFMGAVTKICSAMHSKVYSGIVFFVQRNFQKERASS